jgi:hypothetical protein
MDFVFGLVISLADWSRASPLVPVLEHHWILQFQTEFHHRSLRHISHIMYKEALYGRHPHTLE